MLTVQELMWVLSATVAGTGLRYCMSDRGITRRSVTRPERRSFIGPALPQTKSVFAKAFKLVNLEFARHVERESKFPSAGPVLSPELRVYIDMQPTKMAMLLLHSHRETY